MKMLITAIALAAASAAALAESPLASGPVNQTTTSVTPRAAMTQEMGAARAAFLPKSKREEVRAELMAARAAGTLIQPGELGQVPPPFMSTRTRAEVRGELMQNRRSSLYTIGYQPA